MPQWNFGRISNAETNPSPIFLQITSLQSAKQGLGTLNLSSYKGQVHGHKRDVNKHLIQEEQMCSKH